MGRSRRLGNRLIPPLRTGKNEIKIEWKGGRKGGSLKTVTRPARHRRSSNRPQRKNESGVRPRIVNKTQLEDFDGILTGESLS